MAEPKTPCTCITAHDRMVCVGWCRMADIDADELERAIRRIHHWWREPKTYDPRDPDPDLVLAAARAHLASLRTKADSGREVETEEQAAIRAALTSLVSACHKIPMARMTPFGYECPHCDAKAGESCRPKCWWPTIEAAIADGQEALKAAKERGNA